MFTRREFIVTGASAGLAWARLAAQTAEQKPFIGYVSVRRDNRIAIFTMDPATGKVTWRQQVPVPGGPDPLAFDPAAAGGRRRDDTAGRLAAPACRRAALRRRTRRIPARGIEKDPEPRRRDEPDGRVQNQALPHLMHSVQMDLVLLLK